MSWKERCITDLYAGVASKKDTVDVKIVVNLIEVPLNFKSYPISLLNQMYSS